MHGKGYHRLAVGGMTCWLTVEGVSYWLGVGGVNCWLGMDGMTCWLAVGGVNHRVAGVASVLGWLWVDW